MALPRSTVKPLRGARHFQTSLVSQTVGMRVCVVDMTKLEG